MNLTTLKPKTPRKSPKRMGRGGKRGTTAGSGTKGQKSRAGAGVRSGFRGGDNRLWQLFPKLRGASKKHGSKRPHRKHRFFSVKWAASYPVNLSELNVFSDGDTVSVETLRAKKLIGARVSQVKVLASGELKRKLSVAGVAVSQSAQAKIERAGGSVTL